MDVVWLVVLRLRVHAAREIEDFDLAELGRMALGLNRDVALAERLAIGLHGWIEPTDVGAADLHVVVLEHFLSPDKMRNVLRATDLRLHAHPLIAAKGG